MAEEKQTLRISLIPEGGEVWTPVDLRRRAIAFGVFLFLCLAVISATIFFLKRQERKLVSVMAAKNKEIENVKAETERLSADYAKLSRLAGQLKAGAALVEAHPSFSKVFDLIESKTLPEVYYSNMIGATQGRTLSLEARAPSFDTAARQIIAFREAKQIEKANVSTLSAELDALGTVKNIKFTLTLLLRESAFK